MEFIGTKKKVKIFFIFGAVFYCPKLIKEIFEIPKLKN